MVTRVLNCLKHNWKISERWSWHLAGVHTTEGGVASEPPAVMKSLTVVIATMRSRLAFSFNVCRFICSMAVLGCWILYRTLDLCGLCLRCSVGILKPLVGVHGVQNVNEPVPSKRHEMPRHLVTRVCKIWVWLKPCSPLCSLRVAMFLVECLMLHLLYIHSWAYQMHLCSRHSAQLILDWWAWMCSKPCCPYGAGCMLALQSWARCAAGVRKLWCMHGWILLFNLQILWWWGWYLLFANLDLV
jgi:hypothetical protein